MPAASAPRARTIPRRSREPFAANGRRRSGEGVLRRRAVASAGRRTCHSRRGSERSAASRSCEKPVGVARVGEIAGLARAEPAQPVARDPGIKAVTPRKRYHAEDRRKRPRKTEACGNADHSFRFEGGDAVRNQDHGLIVARVKAVVGIERLAERRLRGQKPKDAGPVVAQNERRRGRAENAKSVEMMIGLSSAKGGTPPSWR